MIHKTERYVIGIIKRAQHVLHNINHRQDQSDFFYSLHTTVNSINRLLFEIIFPRFYDR